MPTPEQEARKKTLDKLSKESGAFCSDLRHIEGAAPTDIIVVYSTARYVLDHRGEIKLMFPKLSPV